MRVIHKIGANFLIIGLFLIAAGGMNVHRGPDGVCIRVNLVHGIGGVLLLGGMLLSIVAAFAGSTRNADSGAASKRREM